VLGAELDSRATVIANLVDGESQVGLVVLAELGVKSILCVVWL